MALSIHLLRARLGAGLTALAFGLAACLGPTPTAAPTLPTTPAATAALAATDAGATAPPGVATPLPTVVPTATAAPPVLGLLMPAAAAAPEAWTALAGAQGWQVVTATPAEAASLAALAPRAIVSLTALPPADLQVLASAAPEAIIVAPVGAAVDALPPNVLGVGGPESREDQAGFLAGVIAGLATDFDRVAVISQPDTVEGRKYRNGFTAGVRYICPKCRIDVLDLPAEVTAEAAAAEALKLVAVGVEMFGVAPFASAEAVYAALGTRAVRVVLSRPARAEEAVLAAAYLDPAAALRPALEAALAGGRGLQPLTLANGGVAVAVVSDPDGRLSPLDLQDLEAARQRLAGGELETGVDPVTGEER